MKIIFNPPVNTENKYIDILVDGLLERGYQVERLDDFFSSWSHFKSIRLVHLNWFENLDDSSLTSTLKSFFRKITVLIAIRLGNKKLVWTMHNRLSHEKKSGKWSNYLTHLLVYWADAIVIHSEVSRNLLIERYKQPRGKIVHIPHPDFVSVYGPALDNPIHEDTTLRLLFIGAIKPYKNIELLIEACGKFDKSLMLTIAGNPKTDSYGTELKALASKYRNMRLCLEFIPDGELPGLLSKADILVLPYNLESSLNSGTVILAFSYRKTVICPKIGTIEDLNEGQDNMLSYTYQSPSHHLHTLEKTIQHAITMKKDNPLVFNEMGDRMQSLVSRENNKSLVCEKLNQLYLQLIG